MTPSRRRPLGLARENRGQRFNTTTPISRYPLDLRPSLPPSPFISSPSSHHMSPLPSLRNVELNRTFFCVNILMVFRTTSIPRESDAFSSSTAFWCVHKLCVQRRRRAGEREQTFMCCWKGEIFCLLWCLAYKRTVVDVTGGGKRVDTAMPFCLTCGWIFEWTNEVGSPTVGEVSKLPYVGERDQTTLLSLIYLSVCLSIYLSIYVLCTSVAPSF